MKKLLVLINVLLLCAMTFAQYKKSPTISSIIPVGSSNYYDISWNLTEGAFSYRFHLYDFINHIYIIEKDSIANPPYRIEIPNDSIVFFAIEANYSNGGEPNLSGFNMKREPLKDAPSNIWLTATFDKCDNGLIFHWNKFYYPDTISTKYLLYCGGTLLGKNDYEEIDETTRKIQYSELEQIMKNANDSTFNILLFKNLSDGNIGNFSSNKVTVRLPDILEGPVFIEATGTRAMEKPEKFTLDELKSISVSNKINLEFHIDSKNEFNDLLVLRSKLNNSSIFDTIKNMDFKLNGDTIFTFEDEIEDSLFSKQYFYKIQVLNSCYQLDKESNIESNIPLKAEPTANYSLGALQWKPYQRFRGDFKGYEVFRLRAGREAETLGIFSITSMNDDLSKLGTRDVGELICYYVVAIEENNPNGINGKAYSNLSCFRLSENLKVGSYLVLGPGCSPQNSSFLQFIPNQDLEATSDYLLIITDRWGTKVWETKNYHEGWNGTYLSSGNVVQEGAYMYFIKYKRTNQTGTIYVTCP